ncbi:MAG: hypothetical protein C5B58_10680 [Acidobacteria bacterium]|nr:MAG: hypothetical protein C5B58_10680 [Acidobacteriota bacterium]
MGVVPTHAQVSFLALYRRDAGTAVPVRRSSFLFRAHIRLVFLYRGVPGKLEMSPVRTSIFQGIIL